MANTVERDRQGPDWPLGNIIVVTPGTPVSIMSLVDPTGLNDPSAATIAGADEYTIRCQQIIFQGFKAGAGPPKLVPNTGLIYVVRKNVTGILDTGVVIATIGQGGYFGLGSAALNRNVFSPYRYYIDADNANDAAQVCLIIQ